MKNENNPKVTTFNGIEKIPKIGFKNLKRRDNKNPLTIRVFNPPTIFTPDKSSESIKREIALKTV